MPMFERFRRFFVLSGDKTEVVGELVKIETDVEDRIIGKSEELLGIDSVKIITDFHKTFWVTTSNNFSVTFSTFEEDAVDKAELEVLMRDNDKSYSFWTGFGREPGSFNVRFGEKRSPMTAEEANWFSERFLASQVDDVATMQEYRESLVVVLPFAQVR